MGIQITQITGMERDTRLADAEHRLSMLEVALWGRSHARPEAAYLLRLYIEAVRRPDFKRITAQTAWLWCSVLSTLGSTELLYLARECRDPFPWVPFLRLLEKLEVAGYDVEATLVHLRRAGNQLLVAQGLGKLRVDDAMRSPDAIQRSFAAIS